MLIQDNGVVLKGMFHPGAGIGTSNMEERVKALNGIITFGTKDGFRIFISVPKKGRMKMDKIKIVIIDDDEIVVMSLK